MEEAAGRRWTRVSAVATRQQQQQQQAAVTELATAPAHDLSTDNSHTPQLTTVGLYDTDTPASVDALSCDQTRNGSISN